MCLRCLAVWLYLIRFYNVRILHSSIFWLRKKGIDNIIIELNDSLLPSSFSNIRRDKDIIIIILVAL